MEEFNRRLQLVDDPRELDVEAYLPTQLTGANVMRDDINNLYKELSRKCCPASEIMCGTWVEPQKSP